MLPHNDLYYRGLKSVECVYEFENGTRFEGEWRRPMRHGAGRMTYPDGSRREGEWRHDMKQWLGVYFYPNGDIYTGAWFRGIRHGPGNYLFADTQIKFTGTWIEGVLKGPGKISYPRDMLGSNHKGPGCFVFDTVFMQHAFYLVVQDPPVIEKEQGEEIKEEKELKEMLGKMSLGRTRNLADYMTEFLHPELVPLLITHSSQNPETDLPDLLQFEMLPMGTEYKGGDRMRQQFPEESQQE